jgi:hypothetical protein
MVVEKSGKKGFFGGFYERSREEGLYKNLKTAKMGVFPRIQGVFPTGESIGGGFES